MKKSIFQAALLVGIAFDILFWEKIPGISFPFFVAITLAVGFLILKKEKIRLAKASVVPIIFILLFSVMAAVRKEPLTSFLNIVAVLGLMMLLAMTYQGAQWIFYGLREYLNRFFRFLGVVLVNPVLFNNQPDQQISSEDKRSWWAVLKPVLRGVLLALPVLLVFTALFASADLVFAEKVKSLRELFRLEDLPEYLFRTFLVLAISYIYLGAVVFAARHSQSSHTTGADTPRLQPFLGFTESTIILSSVLVLFALFILIQIEYFFSGQVNISSQGFTYAEYARRGFGELVVVALFSILLIKCLQVISKRNPGLQARIFTWLALGIVVLVLVVLWSANQRLVLYESAYGFSRSRAYAHVFIIWLAFMLVGMAFIELIRHKQAFINIGMTAALGFALTLNIMDMDRFIVNNNIAQAQQGMELDVAYLSSLSADSIPALVQSYQSGDHPPEVQDGVGAALVCLQETRLMSSNSGRPWQSFHFSDWAAEKSLQPLQQDLNQYRIEKKVWEIQVVSPDGQLYPCQGGFLFD